MNLTLQGVPSGRVGSLSPTEHPCLPGLVLGGLCAIRLSWVVSPTEHLRLLGSVLRGDLPSGQLGPSHQSRSSDWIGSSARLIMSADLDTRILADWVTLESAECSLYLRHDKGTPPRPTQPKFLFYLLKSRHNSLRYQSQRAKIWWLMPCDWDPSP